MKVLAFEDSVNIESLLISCGINVENFQINQYWESSDFLKRIEEFNPDIFLLDHYMPPTKGLRLLQELINSNVKRPEVIVAMSSASMANQAMLSAGADYGIEKFKLGELKIWAQS